MPVRKHRDYENSYPSVTTVLNELRKPGLEYWYKQNTPLFIDRAMREGKQAGTDTHSAIENYITTGELKVETQFPTEVTNALQSFVLFHREHPEIKLIACEHKMTSETLKFNGTMDINAEIDGLPVIGDWKTSNAKDKPTPDIYDEYITQVSAYRHLFHEVVHVYVKSAFIVSLAKDKIAYNFRLLDDEEMYQHFRHIFLPALTICNFKRRK